MIAFGVSVPRTARARRRRLTLDRLLRYGIPVLLSVLLVGVATTVSLTFGFLVAISVGLAVGVFRVITAMAKRFGFTSTYNSYPRPVENDVPPIHRFSTTKDRASAPVAAEPVGESPLEIEALADPAWARSLSELADRL